MKKIGEIFQEERKKRHLSISEVVKKTKIPQKFLLAIESGDYSQLPCGLYPHLYVKEYSRFLKLSEKKMVAIFRRDYRSPKSSKKRFYSTNLKSWLRWQRFLGGGLIILIFGGYLFYQYISFVSPPKIKLVVTNLPSGEKVIKGKTDTRATLKIDGEIVNLDKNGRFSFLVKDKDKKEIDIVAESPAGKKRKIVEKLKR